MAKTEFKIMTEKADAILKRVKRDIPAQGDPGKRFVFIKAIQARLSALESETLKQIQKNYDKERR